MRVLDIEGVENGGRINLSGPSGSLGSVPLPVTGNHAAGVAPVGVSGVSRMVVVLNGSGAIDEVEVDASYCGDVIVQAPEACDDGNQNGGDGCSAICQPEISAARRSPSTACASTLARRSSRYARTAPT